MGKRAYIVFVIFAVFCAVAIPYLAIHKEGGESASPESVPASLQDGKELFVTNCGACHTLAKAGTDGVVGPDLDTRIGSAADADGKVNDKTLTANETRVLAAIDHGIAGRMPAGILSGAQAKEVANFVASVAGQ